VFTPPALGRKVSARTLEDFRFHPNWFGQCQVEMNRFSDIDRIGNHSTANQLNTLEYYAPVAFVSLYQAASVS